MRVVSVLSRHFWSLTLVFGMVVFAQPAMALDIFITGTPGTGVTTWTFTGSTTVDGGPITIDDENGQVSWGWFVGNGFYSGSNVNIDFLSTNATMTVGATVYDVLGVGAEANRPDDVFGLAIEDETLAPGSYVFNDDDELVFSGSATAPVDILEFALGETNASDWYNDLGTEVAGTLPVTFKVSFETAVPATGGFALTLMLLLMLGVAWRKLA